jgi:uncharacterized protein YbjT (DUF2867 family)
MKNMKILVFGATGNVGSKVAKMLAENNHDFLVATRSGNSEFGDSARRLIYDDSATYEHLFDGVKGVFMTTPGNQPELVAQFGDLINRAKDSGIEHIVFSSVMGADANPELTHRKIELMLENSGIAYTLLRPNFYMQNFFTYEWPNTQRGIIYVPTDNGKASYIDTNNIAEAFINCIFNEQHYNKAYTLTGPEALDHFEIASLFSKTYGKEFKNINPTLEEYEKTLQSYEIPQPMIDYFKQIYSYLKSGYFCGISKDFENITGHKGTLFSEFLKENQATLSEL